MANKLTELSKVLKTEKDETITLEQLQEARKIYVEIAKEGYKSKKWVETNMALNKLNAGFLSFLENLDEEELEAYHKTLFTSDDARSYNAVLAVENDNKNPDSGINGLDNVLSIKIKKDSVAKELIDKYNFYLI